MQRENDLGERVNEYSQPIGAPMPQWQPAKALGDQPMTGRYCRLERVDVERHANDLYEAYSTAPDGRDWTYLSVGPFETCEAYRDFLASCVASPDPLHHTVIDLATGKAVGTLSLMRIDKANGVIEVGFVVFSQRLQKTRMATESIFLLMQRAFDELGYRRFEWKCHNLNEPSKRAAERFGFIFEGVFRHHEGVFRHHMVIKGQNRDTAWFAMTDDDWPRIKTGYVAWLAPENFDDGGQQKTRLTIPRAQ